MNTNNATDLKQLAWETFQRDFPKLYAERRGQWVAYQGDRILGFNTQRHILFQELLAQGLTRDDFFIFCIVPHEDEIWMWPHAVD